MGSCVVGELEVQIYEVQVIIVGEVLKVEKAKVPGESGVASVQVDTLLDAGDEPSDAKFLRYSKCSILSMCRWRLTKSIFCSDVDAVIILCPKQRI